MPEHEEKSCPRCKGPFNCKANSISECKCSKVELSAAQRESMAERYQDCLCTVCLVDESQQRGLQQENITESRTLPE